MPESNFLLGKKCTPCFGQQAQHISLKKRKPLKQKQNLFLPIKKGADYSDSDSFLTASVFECTPIFLHAHFICVL
jgi:hypothetical protein